MEKERRKNVDTQIRLGLDLYDYIKSEAERLCVSMNYTMNGLLDEGRRFRQAQFILRENKTPTNQ